MPPPKSVTRTMKKGSKKLRLEYNIEKDVIQDFTSTNIVRQKKKDEDEGHSKVDLLAVDFAVNTSTFKEVTDEVFTTPNKNSNQAPGIEKNTAVKNLFPELTKLISCSLTNLLFYMQLRSSLNLSYTRD